MSCMDWVKGLVGKFRKPERLLSLAAVLVLFMSGVVLYSHFSLPHGANVSRALAITTFTALIALTFSFILREVRNDGEEELRKLKKESIPHFIFNLIAIPHHMYFGVMLVSYCLGHNFFASELHSCIIGPLANGALSGVGLACMLVLKRRASEHDYSELSGVRVTL